MKISLSLLGLIASTMAVPHAIRRQDNDVLFCEDGIDVQGDLLGQAFDNGKSYRNFRHVHC